ncbi:MAG: 2OG-Fe(II) oxygenase [Hyphomicrobiales bacterium]
MQSLFDFSDSTFRYEPYPIAMAKNVLSPEIYSEMLESWPETERFLYMPNLGHKYSLSEVNNAREYKDVVTSVPIWKRVHEEVKSEQFIHGVLDWLIKKNVDLGFRKNCVVTNKPSLNLLSRLKEAYRGAALLGSRVSPLRSRFEFSILPGDGGSIRPHTDAPTKFITLVLAMVEPGKWKKEYGGDTAVVWPKDPTRTYNFANSYLEFDEVNELESFQFDANQCLIFVKTYNSWHSVKPITAPDASTLRKTLTINIEAPRGWI